MTTLLEIKERLRQIYGKYSLYIMAGIRFFTALTVFLLINRNIGFMTRLKNPAVSLVLALVCAFLPANVIIFAAAGLTLLHLYTASMEFALVMLIIYVLMFLLYFRFTPKYAFVVLLTPIAFVLKIPYVIPLVMGILATPIVVIPVSFGIISYYLLYYMKESAAALVGSEIESTMQKYVYVMEHTLKSPLMYLMLAAFALTLITVYLVRRMSIDRSWTIAIFVGALLDILVLVSGEFILDVSVGLVWLLVGSVFSIIIACLLQAFVFSVDYTRTEYVQFEDDEYYYYVKAVPKMMIAKRDKTVKRINPQKKIRDERKRGYGSLH